MPEPAPLILLVDDDVDFLDINRQVLEPRGYRIVAVTDPVAAWERIQQEPPALVISDLMMSALDSGFSLTRRLREDPRFRTLPIILVTAVSSSLGLDFRPRTPADLAALGVDAFFDKPVRPQALLDKVAELLARGRPETP